MENQFSRIVERTRVGKILNSRRQEQGRYHWLHLLAPQNGRIAIHGIEAVKQ